MCHQGILGADPLFFCWYLSRHDKKNSSLALLQIYASFLSEPEYLACDAVWIFLHIISKYIKLFNMFIFLLLMLNRLREISLKNLLFCKYTFLISLIHLLYIGKICNRCFNENNYLSVWTEFGKNLIINKNARTHRWNRILPFQKLRCHFYLWWLKQYQEN